MSKRIAVLMGGWSAEREVSLVSGTACADALERRGHDVVRIDVERDLSALLDAMEAMPDVECLAHAGGEFAYRQLQTATHIDL